MSKKDHYSLAAVSYARAMLELGSEAQAAEMIGRELGELRQIVEGNATLAAFLADPGISKDERQGVVERVLVPQVSGLVQKLLGVMNRKGRLALLPEVSMAYDDLLDKQLGNVEVEVGVAQELDSEQLQQVGQSISRALKKHAMVRQVVDDSIIGGLVVRVEDRLIDGSVRCQLEAMRQQLLGAKPR